MYLLRRPKHQHLSEFMLDVLLRQPLLEVLRLLAERQPLPVQALPRRRLLSQAALRIHEHVGRARIAAGLVAVAGGAAAGVAPGYFLAAALCWVTVLVALAQQALP